MADRDETYYRMRNIWYGILHRCYNQKNPNYLKWGARGITVSDEWHSFDVFYADMRPTYIVGLSLGRRNNDAGYCKENCQWETKKQQANNRTTSRFFTIAGVTKTLAEWCDTAKSKPSTIRQRLFVYGWTIEQALRGKRGNQIG